MPRQARLSRGWYGRIASVALVTLSALAAYEMRYTPSSPGFSEHFLTIVDTKAFPELPELVVRSHYTGIANVDYGLRFLVAAFLPGAAGFVKEFQVLQAYFLISFFAIISIHAVEAGRRANKRAWTYHTTIWALFYQTVGGAVIIPLYCLAPMRDTAKPAYYAASSRQLPTSYARSLVPALLFGFLFPTIVIYLPFNDPGLVIKQGLVAFWQPAPLFVNLVLHLLPYFFGASSTPAASTTTKSDTDADTAYVKWLYGICFITSAATHLSLILFRLLDPELSLIRIFVPHTELLPGSAAETLHFIFQWDYLLIFAASMLWACVAVYDLRVVGRADVSLAKLGFAVIVGSFMLGPAATIAGAFWWREDKLRRETRPKAS